MAKTIPDLLLCKIIQNHLIEFFFLFVKAMTPLGVHFELCIGNVRGDFPGSIRTKGLIPFTTDDQGGAVDFLQVGEGIVIQA